MVRFSISKAKTKIVFSQPLFCGPFGRCFNTFLNTFCKVVDVFAKVKCRKHCYTSSGCVLKCVKILSFEVLYSA